MCKIDFSLILVIIALIHKAENKRYDIETQCKEEFGLTLEGVLKQFRRSDDYVKIIRHKLKEIMKFFEDALLQSYDYNFKKMIKSIEADFGINHDEPTTTKQTKAASNAVPHKRNLGIHRLRRNNENKSQKTSREQIEQIDAIPTLKSHLTVDERNKYKELAYTFSGDIIHSVIEALGGKMREDAPPHGSTQIVSDGAVNETTTQHVLRHTVEHPSTKKQYHDTDLTRQKTRARAEGARKFMSSYGDRAIETLGGKMREDVPPYGSTEIVTDGAENETTTQHILRHTVEHPSAKEQYHDTDVTKQEKIERAAGARKFMSSYGDPYMDIDRRRNTEESYEWRETTHPQRLMDNSGSLSVDDNDKEEIETWRR